MKTDLLIQELASQVVPVRPLAHPLMRMFHWLCFALPFVTLGVYTIGFRKDINTVILTSEFLLQVAILFLLFAVMSVSTFFLSVPDLRSKKIVSIALVSFSIWLITFATPILTSSVVSAGEGIRCLRNILVLGLIPTAVLILFLAKTFPLKRTELVSVALTSTFGLGCLGTRFICPNDDPLHFFAWHCVPVLVMALAGALLTVSRLK